MRFEKTTARLLGSMAVRKAYSFGRRVPLVGDALHLLAKVAHLQGPGWAPVLRGPARGLWLLLDPRYEVGYLRGDHEPWLAEILERWLRPGDTFVDVGAHVGYFSLCAARIVGPGGRVVAFEPDPDNFRRLQNNVARNQLEGVVQPVEAAVGGATGVRFFRRATPLSARVEGTLTDTARNGDETISVTVGVLDRLLQGSDPRLIKVDVEGAEIEVLDGGAETLKRRIACWVIELHTGEPQHAIPAILQEAGYDVRLLRPEHPVYRDYRKLYAIAEPVLQR